MTEQEASTLPATIELLTVLSLRGGDVASQQLIERFQAWRWGASPHSIRNVYGDLKRFGAWAAINKEQTVPASVAAVGDYVSHLKYEGKALATIERALASISLAHRLAGVIDVTKDETIRWRMKGVRKDLAGTRRKAQGLRFDAGLVALADILALPNRKLSDLRDKALISTAYDTGLRRAELVAVHTHHVTEVEDGFELFIPAIKGGFEGYHAFLTPESVRLVREWMRGAGLAQEIVDADGKPLDNPLFRAVDRFDRVARQALAPGSVNTLFKAMVRRAGEARSLGPEQIAEAVKRVSGHSTRVGSTQDLFDANIELGPICHARRWKDPRMAMRYVEELSIQKGPVGAVFKGQRATRNRAQG